MATVVFYGDLQKYGKRFALDVATAGEAMRALFTQIKGLRQHINKGGYFVRVARVNADSNTIKGELNKLLNHNDVIHIVPEITGAGKFGGIILGAALIGLSFVPGMQAFAPQLIMAGAGLILGGAAQLLMKPPAYGESNTVDPSKSSSFSNLENQAAEGSCVPIAYGRMRCGAKTISQSIESYNTGES